MKKRNIISVFTLVFVILGLFAACDIFDSIFNKPDTDSEKPDSDQPDSPITVSGNTLAAKLQWVSANAKSNSGYLLEVTNDEDLPPQNLTYTGKSNITIQLKGIGSSKNIALSGTGSLFSIFSSVTLILDENLILSGKDDNTASLVTVNSGGTLIMNQGVKITDNTSSSNYDGGGGVYVDNGTFTMNGGEISNNTAFHNAGGVFVSNGTFTMNDGKVSGNFAKGDSSFGGGVVVSYYTFTMNGGEISGNTAAGIGGGVYTNGTFTMNGGVISGNTAAGIGGGVCMEYGTFTMNDGEISGNTVNYALDGGGGVYIYGIFTMNGGIISGNTSNSNSNSNSNSTSTYGGGVYVSGGTFTKSGGGTITGYGSDLVNGNVVKRNGVVQNYYGHAVYVYYSTGIVKRKETTASPTDNLSVKGSNWSGAWDN